MNYKDLSHSEYLLKRRFTSSVNCFHFGLLADYKQLVQMIYEIYMKGASSCSSLMGSRIP